MAAHVCGAQLRGWYLITRSSNIEHRNLLDLNGFNYLVRILQDQGNSPW